MTTLLKPSHFLLGCLILLLGANTSIAQNSDDIRNEILNQFENASEKMVSLAEAMPEDTYEWSPDGEAMPVAQVYMHIARYNYALPEMALEKEAPGNIDLDTMEEIRDKEEVIDHLKRSNEYLKTLVAELSEEELSESTELYGRTVDKWTALLQLQTHLNEHLGQSIAYARMNQITPPWSE